MDDQLKQVFGTITKRSLLGDGSVLVEGRLAGETLDMDGQVLDYDWLKTALPEWAKRGNIRVMHNRQAVGKLVELVGDDEKREFHMSAKIVDPVEAKKCLEDVYTGWSGGIKQPVVKGIGDPAHPMGRVVGGRWIESSLVDYPCDENNNLIVHKGATPTNVLQFQAEGAAGEDDPEEGEPPVSGDEPATPSEPAEPEPPPSPSEGLTRAARALVRALVSDEDFNFDIVLDTHRNVITYVDAAHNEERLAAAPALKVAVAALEHAIEQAPDANYKVAAQALQGTLRAMVSTTAAPPPVPKKEPAKPVTTKGADVTDEQALEILNKISALESVATPDAMKTVLEAAVAKATEPLVQRIVEMEERAAAGGPMIGPTRKLGASVDTAKQAQVALYTRYLDHPDRSVAAGAREELEKLAE